jgi:hypothetical protein
MKGEFTRGHLREGANKQKINLFMVIQLLLPMLET